MNTITIDLAEYYRLLADSEMLADILAHDAAMKDRSEGMPMQILRRIIDGENPVKVIREWRRLTKAELARRAGLHRMQLHDIEMGKSRGSMNALKAIAGRWMWRWMMWREGMVLKIPHRTLSVSADERTPSPTSAGHQKVQSNSDECQTNNQSDGKRCDRARRDADSPGSQPECPPGKRERIVKVSGTYEGDAESDQAAQSGPVEDTRTG